MAKRGSRGTGKRGGSRKAAPKAQSYRHAESTSPMRPEVGIQAHEVKS